MIPLLLCLFSVTAVASGPGVRHDTLDRVRHVALEHEMDLLLRRYAGGRADIPVEAVADGAGGVYLMVSPGPRARLYRIDAAGRIVWSRDDALVDLGAQASLIPSPRGGFAVSSRREERDDSKLIFRAFDSAGVTRWTTEIELGGRYSPLVVPWSGGWFLAQHRQGRSPRTQGSVVAHRVSWTGELPWGEGGRVVVADDRAAALSVIEEASSNMLLVWHSGGGTDFPPTYRAQRLTRAGNPAWPEARLLGEAVRAGGLSASPRSVELHRLEEGVHASLFRGSSSCMHSSIERYGVLISPSGEVRPSALSAVSYRSSWAGSHPMLRALPAREGWPATRGEGPELLDTPCSFEESKGGHFSTATDEHSHCVLWPRPILPPTAAGTVRLATEAGGVVVMRDRSARGSATPELPVVGYERGGGAIAWVRDLEGVHAWTLFFGQDDEHVFELSEPHFARMRSGAVEIVDDTNRVVMTLVISHHVSLHDRGRSWVDETHDEDATARLEAEGSLFRLVVTGPSHKHMALRLTFVEGSTMGTPRTNAIALPMSGGRFAIIGGVPPSGATRRASDPPPVEIFDPRTGDWSSGPEMPFPGRPVAVARVGSRRHLMAIAAIPGQEGTTGRIVEWHEKRGFGSLHEFPAPFSAIRLTGTGDGRVLVIGRDRDQSRLLDSKTWTWSELEAPLRGLQFPSAYLHAPVQLEGSRVVYVGNSALLESPYRAGPIYPGEPLPVYEPGSGSWSEISGLPQVSHCTDALHVGRDRIIAVCGQVWLYEPNTGQWREIVDRYRRVLRAAMLPDGRVLMLTPEPNRTSIYDPATDTASETCCPRVTQDVTTIIDAQGRVWLLGGSLRGHAATPSVFDPRTNSWLQGSGPSPGEVEEP